VDLKGGEADIAVRLGPIVDNELILRKLCDAGFSLYASAAYLARRPAPDDPNDLTGQEIIGYDATLVPTPMASWIDSHASGATIVLRSREMTDVLSAALGGVGLALLPCILGDEEPGLRRLTKLVIASHPIFIVYAREARISAAMRAVIRFVTTMMRQQARRIGGRQ
jgi:DNA-binding transcriptional LysR family regulator